MSHTRGPSNREINQLLREEWPKIQAILEKHSLTERDSDQILHETLLALVFRWRHIEDPTYWLLKTLEARCEKAAPSGARRSKPKAG